jgi:hypothetical protein
MGIILRTQKMAAGHVAAAFHKHQALQRGWGVDQARLVGLLPEGIRLSRVSA